MNKNNLLDCWIMFSRDNDNLSVDRLVCKPDLRKEFLESAAKVCGCDDEQTILWALMGLRKNKTLKKRREELRA